MLYPTRSKEKSPSAAIRTPAAVRSTERITWNEEMKNVQKLIFIKGENRRHQANSNTKIEIKKHEKIRVIDCE